MSTSRASDSPDLVSRYLAEATKHPLLSRQQEAALVAELIRTRSRERAQELVAMTFYHQYDLPVSVLRLTAVVGLEIHVELAGSRPEPWACVAGPLAGPPFFPKLDAPGSPGPARALVPDMRFLAPAARDSRLGERGHSGARLSEWSVMYPCQR